LAPFESGQGLLDTLTWRKTSSTNISFLFLPADSVAMWLKPQAQCSLKAIRIHFKSFAGNILIDVYRARYDGHITTTDSTDAFGWVGTHQNGQWMPGWVLGHSPLGEHLWGPFPLTVTSEMNNSWVEVSASLVGEADLGDGPFCVGMMMFQQSGHGLSAEQEYTVPYHFFKYYADCCGPDGVHNGWFLRSYSLWVEAVVSYYGNTPPLITNMDELNDTYGSGPYPITAQIVDHDLEDPGRAGISAAYLHWSVNGLADSTTMTGPSEGGLFAGHIPSPPIGEEVEYWVSAVDEVGLQSANIHQTFARLEPVHPEASLLLVGYRYGFDLPEFYKELFDSLEYVYEYWNVDAHGGIDSSVTNYGWNTVILWGQVRLNEPPLPTRGYADNMWADFLQTGSADRPLNLCYAELFYFGLNYEPWNPTFEPGDFAYDFFGLDSATTEDGIGNEKTLYGVIGDPVTGSFAEEPFRHTWPLDWFHQYWMKYTKANELGADLFFTVDDEGTGVRCDGGTFRTVFLPWNVEYLLEDTGTDIVASQDFRRLMGNILDWFGTAQELTKGDVNRDGQVNVLDVLRGANIILGFPPAPSASELWAADCNGDEAVNVLDLIGIVNVILGIGTCPP
ncbi:MAG: dockerin type I repeat-containing protein, partial [bacterium]